MRETDMQTYIFERFALASPADAKRVCMKSFVLVIALMSCAVNANDFIGIPIGSTMDFEPIETETRALNELSIKGPFTGLFAIFDQYKARVSVKSGLLVMAEAEKTYESFEVCSVDTTEIWEKLKHKFGSPALDENQSWWFDMGNQQKISVDCSIYGKSGKIAMNVRVVDSKLALEANQGWEGKKLNQ